MRGDDRGGDVDDKAVDEAVEGERAEPLGQRRRALDIDEQEDALLQPRPVVAAGDEVEQHILPEQMVHVVDEPDGQDGGEGEQEVAARDREQATDLRRCRKEPRPDRERKQDDRQIDDRLRHQGHQERRPRQPLRRRLRQAPFEGNQNAADQHAGEDPARHAGGAEKRVAVGDDRDHVPVNDADKRTDQGEPQDVSDRPRKSSQMHRGGERLIARRCTLARRGAGGTSLVRDGRLRSTLYRRRRRHRFLARGALRRRCHPFGRAHGFCTGGRILGVLM